MIEEKPQTTRQMLSDIQSKQTRMLTILLGDKEAEQDGLVHKVANHAKYIRSDKRFKWGVATLLFGGTGGFMTWIKSHLGL